MPPLGFRIEPAGARDAPGLDPELLHALATDPDGAFVARGEDGAPLGHAVSVLRGEMLQLLALEVDVGARGRGVGAALYAAVRAFARGRGARALEAAASLGGDGIGFLLGRRLPVRSLLLTLEGSVPGPPARIPLTASRLAAGPQFGGWVADLDRETRGFPRTPEWNRWAETGETWALKSHGRPEAVAALRLGPEGALLGPIAARRPEQAAFALAFLAGRAGVLGRSRARLVVPSESRALLAAAFAAGFRATAETVLLGSRAAGDLRRYAASPGPFL